MENVHTWVNTSLVKQFNGLINQILVNKKNGEERGGRER